MKKLLFTALLGISLATSAFAVDESKISLTIRKNFNDEFKGIENVDWTVKSEFVKASFVKDGEAMNAFYDLKGNKIAWSRNVTTNVLPMSARSSIEQRYQGYKMVEAIEFSGLDEDCYYVTLENEKQTLVLKISSQSSVSVFKKTKKAFEKN